jgi:hypothetical protein
VESKYNIDDVAIIDDEEGFEFNNRAIQRGNHTAGPGRQHAAVTGPALREIGDRHGVDGTTT